MRLQTMEESNTLRGASSGVSAQSSIGIKERLDRLSRSQIADRHYALLLLCPSATPALPSPRSDRGAVRCRPELEHPITPSRRLSLPKSESGKLGKDENGLVRLLCELIEPDGLFDQRETSRASEPKWWKGALCTECHRVGTRADRSTDPARRVKRRGGYNGDAGRRLAGWQRPRPAFGRFDLNAAAAHRNRATGAVDNSW